MRKKITKILLKGTKKKKKRLEQMERLTELLARKIQHHKVSILPKLIYNFEHVPNKNRTRI